MRWYPDEEDGTLEGTQSLGSAAELFEDIGGYAAARGIAVRLAEGGRCVVLDRDECICTRVCDESGFGPGPAAQTMTSMALNAVVVD